MVYIRCSGKIKQWKTGFPFYFFSLHFKGKKKKKKQVQNSPCWCGAEKAECLRGDKFGWWLLWLPGGCIEDKAPNGVYDLQGCSGFWKHTGIIRILYTYNKCHVHREGYKMSHCFVSWFNNFCQWKVQSSKSEFAAHANWFVSLACSTYTIHFRVFRVKFNFNEPRDIFLKVERGVFLLKIIFIVYTWSWSSVATAVAAVWVWLVELILYCMPAMLQKPSWWVDRVWFT